MKKIVSILLLLSLLLCGCGEGNRTVEKEDVESFNHAVENLNSQKRNSGNYLLEITFGDMTVLYYASGEVAWDREAETAFAEFKQTYLGASTEMENYFSKGKMVSIEDGNLLETERESSKVFEMFPYFTHFSYNDSCKGLKKGTNSKGETVSFSRSDTKDIFSKVLGENIYDLVTVLKKPQRDKIEYSDTECVYTFSEGNIISCRYDFDVKLFDTPAYVPGHSQSEEEYTLKLHVVAKVDFKSHGDAVEIKEYSK